MSRCVLCGSERLSAEMREHYLRDYRGQQIVVLICVDARACIDRAVANAEPQRGHQAMRRLA